MDGVSNSAAMQLYLKHDRADCRQSAASVVRQIMPAYLPCISPFTIAAICGLYAYSNLRDVDILHFNRIQMFLILFARSGHWHPS